MTKEQNFLSALRDLFVGAPVEGESGYINLMRIKARYFEQGVFPRLQQDINQALEHFPDFREELFDKLYSFFHRYFSESGSIYFRYTPLHQNVYEKVYTDDRDVMLFWKTHMLYYVKTDRLFQSMDVDVDGQRFRFDVSKLEHKKANEKRDLVYAFQEKRADGALVFSVTYSERGRLTKVDDILRAAHKAGARLDEETLARAFRLFERQSEVDYFINKDARAFLREQFDLWLYQYIFSGESRWTEERIRQLQVLKDIAYKIIDFIAQFEDELVKIWNKPKFVLHAHYVITLDRIAERDTALLERLLAHPNFPQQMQEWRDLGMVDENFAPQAVWETDLLGRRLSQRYRYLPLDTRYFPDLELAILALFDNLDEALDGWLVKSENYQALNTLLPKFRERVNCIYIDPPYNAKTSEILYANTYKHASWMTLMENRINASKGFLSPDQFLYLIAIDDIEQSHLHNLLRQYIFPNNSIACVTVIHNRRGQQGKNLSAVHEYLLMIYPDDAQQYIRERELEEVDHRSLRDSGTESRREDARNCFYPIIVRNKRVVGFGEVASAGYHPKGVNEINDDGTIYVWPIDTSGEERKWRYARQSVETIHDDLEVVETKDGIQIYYNKRIGIVRTVWQDEKYDASEYGTKVLQDLFGENSEFQYPKSVYLMEDTVKLSIANNPLVFDFFAGSGTTAHAIINLNRQEGSKRKYILAEMADYFDTVLLPRVKKVVFCGKWKDGKAAGGKGVSHFVKYFQLEQYEDVLRRAHYADADLFNNPYQNPYSQYVFLRDLKMLDAVQVDAQQEIVQADISKLYAGIDLAETLSCVTGKWIRRITADYVEFADGERVDLRNPAWKLIKPLIWWGSHA